MSTTQNIKIAAHTIQTLEKQPETPSADRAEVKAGVLPTWAPYAAAALHIPVYLMLLEFLRPVERMLRSALSS